MGASRESIWDWEEVGESFRVAAHASVSPAKPHPSPPDFMQNAKRKGKVSFWLLGDLAGDA